MRDLFLAPLLLAILFQTFRTPSAGVLGWTWLTMMTPQKLIWGMLSMLPLNLIVALATLAMVLFTKDRRKLPRNLTVTLWMFFILAMTVTTITAINPALSWGIWNRVVKVMLLGFLVPVLMTTQRRIHALIWVIVMCLGYFGIKGGIFTLMTGSGGHVVGPPDSQLIDNNNLALALCMSLPLMNYLRLQTATPLVRNGLLAAMIATTFGALGTFSRGGMIGLGVMAAYLWWKSPRKISLALGVVAVVVPAFLFMPASWYDRVGTLKDASNQTTFLTRWDAWTVNLNIALARPLTGGGFASSEDGDVYRHYSYGRSMYATHGKEDVPEGFTGGHAAHSIYFETLGDHGFIGCGLYFALLLSTLGVLRRVRKAAGAIPAMAWIKDLVAMIQVSFLAFFVSGTALSMAYYDLVFLFIGIALALDQMVKDYKNNPAETVAGKTAPAAASSGKWRAPAHAV
jgi:probable O-glycosylation ligase (exosortase A-associated)